MPAALVAGFFVSRPTPLGNLLGNSPVGQPDLIYGKPGRPIFADNRTYFIANRAVLDLAVRMVTL